MAGPQSAFEYALRHNEILINEREVLLSKIWNLRQRLGEVRSQQRQMMQRSIDDTAELHALTRQLLAENARLRSLLMERTDDLE